MGASATKETIVFDDVKSGKEIHLVVELCSSWGYGSRQSSVKEFCKYLNKNGFVVTAEFNPQSGGNGEFFVFQKLSDGRKLPIFSNSKNHGDQGAVVSYNLASKMYESIKAKIQ